MAQRVHKRAHWSAFSVRPKRSNQARECVRACSWLEGCLFVHLLFAAACWLGRVLWRSEWLAKTCA